jgi:hypothetical protein
MAWVGTGSTTGNIEIRADRYPGTWGSGVSTGLSLGVADANNFFFAFTSQKDISKPQALTLGYYHNGRRTNLASGVSMPGTWTTLRVVTSSNGRIEVFADGSAVYSLRNGNLASATGAGLYNDSPGMAMVNRWDNLIVIDVR